MTCKVATGHTLPSLFNAFSRKLAVKLLFLVLSAFALLGCASPEYAQYSKAQTDIAVARHAAEAAKYKALSDIASSGNGDAKVAAVMALALGGQGAQQTTLQAPQASQALQWASILVPGLTQVAGMRYNYLSTVAQSNNSASVSMSTNATFASLAGKIQAPGSVTNNTLSGVGTLGSGAYSTTDNTLSGVGTLGSGAYSTTDRNDVTTPAPVVVSPVITPPVVIRPVVNNTPIVVTGP